MVSPPSVHAVPERSIALGGRRLTAVLGPTNTGKTHLAVERMLGHASGMIGLPLRLLAREVYDRVVAKRGAASVALITGEEKILPASPHYFVCTVESMPLDRRVEFLAIDEVQLCADGERGHVFTDRLLRARGEQETMFLGADTMRPLIRQLVPDVQFVSRPRFSDLTYTGPKKLSRLPRRSAIVAFSAEAVYGLAEVVRRQRGGAAVVMGALSPRTRNAQVALYQSGDVDFLVATDAVGMGLNMDVDHVAFASLSKFDGVSMRTLRAPEIAQIAGRAGRHMNDGTFGPTTDVPPFEPALVEQVEQHRFDPIRVLQWRSAALNFASIEALIASLDALPPVKGLARARTADDLAALRLLAGDREIADMARGPSALQRLWDVCQVPDFLRATPDEHVRLLAQIFRHLMMNDDQLPADWMASQVDRIDVTEGDIDTLSARLAQIRIWTYVAHRGWLADAAHWQERTRAIEDRLSDALHEALTQRFIDRRTSVLIKRLREDEDLASTVDADGEVAVEGEYVGRLSGFMFVADPRAESSELGPKTLRHAAQRALAPEIAQRAQRLSSAPASAIQLSEHGKLWWEGSPIARLASSGQVLAPRVELLADDLLSGPARERVQARLDVWTREHIARVLEPLVQLAHASDLEGLGRGLAFQLVEALGSLPRSEVAETVRALEQPARAALRRYGVRFGAHSVFMPGLIKPQASQLRLLLWMVAEDAARKGMRLPPMPQPGLVSLAVENGTPRQFYERAGFRVFGPRAIRLDMLERLADMLRPPKPIAATEPAKVAAAPSEAGPGASRPLEAIFWSEAPALPAGASVVAAPETAAPEAAAPEAAPVAQPASAEKPSAAASDGSFRVTPAMMSIVGCSGAELDIVLRAMGFRPVMPAPDAESGEVRWRPARRQSDGSAPPQRRRARSKRKPDSQRAPAPSDAGSPPAAPDAVPLDAASEPEHPRGERTERREDRRGSGRKDRRQDERGDKSWREKKSSEGRGKRDGQERSGSAGSSRPPREKPFDPTSPFAALAVLKQAMAKRS